MSSRYYFSRKCKVRSQVFNTFCSQVDVVVLPIVGDTYVFLGFEGFDEAKNFEVSWSFNVRVCGGNGVLLYDKNSLTEEVLEYSNAVGLRDEHGLYIISL